MCCKQRAEGLRIESWSSPRGSDGPPAGRPGASFCRSVIASPGVHERWIVLDKSRAWNTCGDLGGSPAKLANTLREEWMNS